MCQPKERPPPGTAVPFSSMTPAEVRVQVLPAASLMLPPLVGVSTVGVDVPVEPEPVEAFGSSELRTKIGTGKPTAEEQK